VRTYRSSDRSVRCKVRRRWRAPDVEHDACAADGFTASTPRLAALPNLDTPLQAAEDYRRDPDILVDPLAAVPALGATPGLIGEDGIAAMR